MTIITKPLSQQEKDARLNIGKKCMHEISLSDNEKADTIDLEARTGKVYCFRRYIIAHFTIDEL